MNDIRKTPEYRQWRDAVKRRDGNACRRCGFENNLHVHHIKPLDKYLEFAVVLDNGLTLCGNCHSLLTGKEETTNLRKFFSNDPKIERQLSVIKGSLTDYLDRKARQRRRQGWEKVHKGQYAVAIKDFDKAIELNPNDANAHYGRGIAKAGLKQHFAAIKDFDMTIELKEDYADAYHNRGIAKHSLEQYDSAIRDFNTAIQLDPNNARAHYNRGLANGQLGQYTTAIIDYDKAIELNPNYAYAYYYSRGFYVNRADAKYHLEQYTAAIIDYDKAIELYPSYTTAYYKRGLANKQLGKYDSAIKDFNTAIQLDPNHAEAREQQLIVQQRIREVEAERKRKREAERQEAEQRRIEAERREAERKREQKIMADFVACLSGGPKAEMQRASRVFNFTGFMAVLDGLLKSSSWGVRVNVFDAVLSSLSAYPKSLPFMLEPLVYVATSPTWEDNAKRRAMEWLKRTQAPAAVDARMSYERQEKRKRERARQAAAERQHFLDREHDLDRERTLGRLACFGFWFCVTLIVCTLGLLLESC